MITLVYRFVLTYSLSLALPALLHAAYPLPWSSASCTAHSDVFGRIEVNTSPYDEDDFSSNGITQGSNGFSQINANSYVENLGVSTEDGNGTLNLVSAGSVIFTAYPGSPYIGQLTSQAAVTFFTYNTGSPVNVYDDLSTSASGTFTVQTNSQFPTKGQAANSAEIYSIFFFYHSNDVSGLDYTFNTTVEAAIGDSYLTFTKMDEAGDYWAAEGQLKDYGNTPIEVSAVHEAHEYVYYYGHEYTQVGDTFSASLDMEHEGSYLNEATTPGYSFNWIAQAQFRLLAP